MEAPLLQTKLYIPPARSGLVVRPRLLERLSEGLLLGRKLTLISAPAGFGKTTLVSEWIDDLSRDTAAESPSAPLKSKIGNRVAWLSLDESDNDPGRFLTYLVAALQRIAPTVGEGVLALLRAGQPHPSLTDSILTALLNDILSLPEHCVLVLDDYHVLESPPIDRALTFLLDHLPPQLHPVITTREDPPLPLARLRARGQLTELRAADLRFTPTEAANFLNAMIGLTLSPEQVAALEARTEGWIAGLQLAALSLRGRENVAGFITTFAGDNRYIVDYLAEEVLQSRPEPVRRFLLQTSLLDRLSGSLCDTVTGQADGREILETLERGNLFVVPLDDQRQWYRYHHLFADALQTHLLQEFPEQVPILHQRASGWYDQNGLPVAAIRHALAAADFEQAANLIELTWPALFNGFQPDTWLGWVRALPDETVRARPVLSLGCAWTLLDRGDLAEAEVRLREAERWLPSADQPEPPAGLVVVNAAAFQTLSASIASARAYLAQTLGDVPATIKHAQRALELWPETDHYQHGLAALFLGLAYWASGQLAAAAHFVADGVAGMQRADNTYFQIVGTVFLAGIRMAQGRLHQAASAYEQSRQLAPNQTGFALQGLPDLYVGLSELARERGDLAAATQHLLAGEKELAEQAVLLGSEARWCVAMARIKQAEGDFDGALDLLQQAERRYKQDPVPDARPLAAWQARVWLAQGKLEEAQRWARERDLPVDDELSYLREFEQLTLARIWIAQYRRDRGDPTIRAALHLLERLLPAAEAEDRLGSTIEILILQALAQEAQGNLVAALGPLKQALTLAEPEGYFRIFVDEGPPMQTLLAESLARGADAVYVTQLLAALNPPAGDDAAPPDPNQLLIEPLSSRELDVLSLVAAGHTNQAIAAELVIAVSTVKKHVNNIFGKLGVGSRTQAVSRARELGLL